MQKQELIKAQLAKFRHLSEIHGGLLPAREAAEVLECHRTFVYALENQGFLQSFETIYGKLFSLRDCLGYVAQKKFLKS